MRCSALLCIAICSWGSVTRGHAQAQDRIVVPAPRVLYQVAEEALPNGGLPAPADIPREFDNDPSLVLPAPNLSARRGAAGDWNEASAGDERVSEVIRAHWVNLNRQGQLIGRISVFDEQSRLTPVSDLQIRFLREGNTLATSRTDTNGRFVESTLRPVCIR